MRDMLDIDKMIIAIHAVTGKWLSGKDAENLVKLVKTREELLAHGILDLAWLEGDSAAKQQLTVLRQSALMPTESLLGIDGPSAPMPESGPDKDELLILVRQFAEDPMEVNPLTTLMRLGAAKVKEQPSRP